MWTHFCTAVCKLNAPTLRCWSEALRTSRRRIIPRRGILHICGIREESTIRWRRYLPHPPPSPANTTYYHTSTLVRRIICILTAQCLALHFFQFCFQLVCCDVPACLRVPDPTQCNEPVPCFAAYCKLYEKWETMMLRNNSDTLN